MVEHSNCHDRIDEKESLDRLLEVDMRRMVVAGRIDAPVVGFSIYSYLANPEI